MYTELCDDNCKGCSKNKNGWCIWKDKNIVDVQSSKPNKLEEWDKLVKLFREHLLDCLEIDSNNKLPEGHPCKYCVNNPSNNPAASGMCCCSLPDMWLNGGLKTSTRTKTTTSTHL